MGETISLTADDGHKLGAYRARPEGAARGGLVVIQEIFGINGHIRSVCDGFAAEGYEVIAPALFDRAEPAIELAYDEAGIARGREIRADIGWIGPVRDMAAAQAALSGAGRVGAVGYCWGGSLAWLAATRLGPACAVSYYVRRPDRPVQGRKRDLPGADAHRRQGREHLGRRRRRHSRRPARHCGPHLPGRPRLQLRPARRLPRRERRAGARANPRFPRRAPGLSG